MKKLSLSIKPLLTIGLINHAIPASVVDNNSVATIPITKAGQYFLETENKRRKTCNVCILFISTSTIPLVFMGDYPGYFMLVFEDDGHTKCPDANGKAFA